MEEQGDLGGGLVLHTGGARGNVKPQQLQLGSTWQTGPDFFRGNRADWPISRDFTGGELPRAEVLVNCFAVAGLQPDWDGIRRIIDMATKTTKLQAVQGTLARVIRAAGKCYRKAIF